MSVTIIVVDDHPIVRQGLRHLLEAEPEFRVVGEAEDGIEALLLIERLKPNILMLDMMMPSLNGLEVLRRIKHISPATRTIVLSMQSADAYVLEVIKKWSGRICPQGNWSGRTGECGASGSTGKSVPQRQALCKVAERAKASKIRHQMLMKRLRLVSVKFSK